MAVSHGRELDWVASIDSTIVRVHQHGATLCRASRGGGGSNYKKFDVEPVDHATVPWGWTTKAHLVADGRWRPVAFVLTSGQTADTSMLAATLDQIRVPGPAGRPRTRPDRDMADKGYPSRANRAWLREHGITATVPERDDQIADRRPRPSRPIDFGEKSSSATRTATSSSAASTSSINGAASRCDQTRPPATTTPPSASPQPSTGQHWI